MSGNGSNVAELAFSSFRKSNNVGLGTISRSDPIHFQSSDNNVSRNFEMLSDGKNTVSLIEHSDNVLTREIIEILSRSNTCPGDNSMDYSLRNAVFPCNVSDTVASTVLINEHISIKFDPSMGRATLSGISNVSLSFEMLAQLISIYAEKGCTIFETDELIFNAIRVNNKGISKDFSGHVYTLQSNNGWFNTSTEGIVTQNCRCSSSAIIPGLDED